MIWNRDKSKDLFLIAMNNKEITNKNPNISAAHVILITKYRLYKYSPSSGVWFKVQSNHWHNGLFVSLNVSKLFPDT